jgi:hypothetical protein
LSIEECEQAAERLGGYEFKHARAFPGWHAGCFVNTGEEGQYQGEQHKGVYFGTQGAGTSPILSGYFQLLCKYDWETTPLLQYLPELDFDYPQTTADNDRTCKFAINPNTAGGQPAAGTLAYDWINAKANDVNFEAEADNEAQFLERLPKLAESYTVEMEIMPNVLACYWKGPDTSACRPNAGGSVNFPITSNSWYSGAPATNPKSARAFLAQWAPTGGTTNKNRQLSLPTGADTVGGPTTQWLNAGWWGNDLNSGTQYTTKNDRLPEIPDGSWTHVAVVYNGTSNEMALFVDKIQVGVKNMGSGPTIPDYQVDQFCLGGNMLARDNMGKNGINKYAAAFVGKMRKIRIWKTAKGVTELGGPTAGPTPGPTGNPTPGPTGNPTPGPTGNPTPGPTSQLDDLQVTIAELRELITNQGEEMRGKLAAIGEEMRGKLAAIEGLLQDRDSCQLSCYGRRNQA